MTNFPAKTPAWLDENCPAAMRTFMPENEHVAAALVALAKAHETLYLCSNERVRMQGV